MSRVSTTLLVASLVALSTSCARSGVSPDAQPAPETVYDGHARLDQRVRPLSYNLALTIAPETTSIEGSVTTAIEVSRATRVVRMHAEGLSLKRVVAVPLGSARTITAQAVMGEHGGVELRFESELAPRQYTLQIDYTGPLGESPMGLYRVRDGARWYAFTQFEPLSARAAFPCFDEPAFKTPFEVTLHVPEGQLALSNSPEVSRVPREDRAGYTTFRFAPTEPLPTYLVAFAVGDFEVIAAPKGAAGEVALRVIAPRGKGHLAAYALELTPRILDALSRYFDQPYPFQKLDLIAVPEFSAGAMENVGLVTFREELLLVDPATATREQRYAVQSVIVHELAHMWFGNLVTPPWWDELWLNESFASWMEEVILDELDPTLEASVRQARSMSWTMSQDSLSQTRAIRQPIREGADIYNAFDGMTYDKGAAVLGMAAAWMRPEVFREALRAYMRDNRYGTVTTPALMAALEATSAKPVYETLRAFLDQPGAPLLSVTPRCESGQASLEVTQQRYAPAGVSLPSGELWRVPMCARIARGQSVITHCEVITRASQRVALPGQGCPDWVHPNADEVGYYHWRLPDDAMRALTSRHVAALTPRERVALQGHLSALVAAEALGAEAFYDIALSLATQEDPALARQGVGAIAGLRWVTRERDALRAPWQALVLQLTDAPLSRLTLNAIPDERPDDASLRALLIRARADAGDDFVIASAQGLLVEFLNDPEGADDTRARWAVALAARYGDPMLFDALVALIGQVKKPSARAIATRALGSFRDPALLRRALDLYLSDTLRANELWVVLGPALDEDLTHDLAWSWLTENFEPIVQKMGVKRAAGLAWIISASCDEARLKRATGFFSALPVQPEGIARNVANATQRAQRCIRERAYARDAAGAALMRAAPAAPQEGAGAQDAPAP